MSIKTACPSGAPEFTPGFQWGSCYSIFSFICIFCSSLFVLLSFFFWLLCCLFFFNKPILITPLASLTLLRMYINLTCTQMLYIRSQSLVVWNHTPPPSLLNFFFTFFKFQLFVIYSGVNYRQVKHLLLSMRVIGKISD